MIIPFPLPPYARTLNMEIWGEENNVPIIIMPFGDAVQGRPGFLHGGAISGLLEMAAVAAIHSGLQQRGSDSAIKQINVTIDFLRGGTIQPTYACGSVTRLGRTLANVEARAWQSDRDKPIAIAQMHYLLKTSNP